MSIKCAVYFILGPIIIIILWVTTQTQLFLTPPRFFFLSGEWPKLFKKIDFEKRRFVWRPTFFKKVANFPDGLLNDFRGASLPR